MPYEPHPNKENWKKQTDSEDILEFIESELPAQCCLIMTQAGFKIVLLWAGGLSYHI